MNSLSLPNICQADLYDKCIGQTQRIADRQTLAAISPSIMAAWQLYHSLASARKCGEYKSIVLDAAQRQLLGSLYERRLVDVNGLGRWAYERIRLSAVICPFCTFGEVYEVDHFLSKSDYPELNINPENLVPICHACNHIKLSKAPQQDGTYFLHPYFDSLTTTEQWLFATIVPQAGGPTIEYEVKTHCLPDDVKTRLSFHFNELMLRERFRGRAAQVLTDMEHDIIEYLNSDGKEFLKRHFALEAARKFRRYGNSIEFAAYQAASTDDVYCSGLYVN